MKAVIAKLQTLTYGELEALEILSQTYSLSSYYDSACADRCIAAIEAMIGQLSQGELAWLNINIDGIIHRVRTEIIQRGGIPAIIYGGK